MKGVRMLKVFVVDDEIWVCELIKKSIKWAELDLEVIGEANDGITAYNMIVEQHPDIVITDIRMPGLDGISLIKKLRESDINCNFIIISGYQNFEYAQNALKLGVEDYILKPVDEEELTDTLIRLRKHFLSSKEQVQKEENLKKLLTNSIEKLKEQFLLKLLFDNELNPMSLEEVNAEYQFKFKNGYFNVLVFKIDHLDIEKTDRNLGNVVFNKISEIIKRGFESSCYEVFTLQCKSKLICVLNYPQENSVIIENCLKKIFQETKTHVELFHSFNLTVGVGSIESELHFLKQSLDSALDSIKCRIIEGVEKIINISKLCYNDLKITEIVSIEKEKQFICMIEVFNINELSQWLKEVFATIFTINDINPCLVFDICYEIIELYFNTMKRLGFSIEEEYISRSRVYEDIDECKSINELLNYLLKLFNESLSFYYDLKQSQSCKPVEIAKSYVSKHYSETINLEDVAKLVYLNPSYFSDFFKKETGVNFSEYVINYRIEIAKELLKNIQYRIADVSEMVGYKDEKYFSKLFKKVVGINPAEYKKLYT